jgi:hypothetical protein
MECMNELLLNSIWNIVYAAKFLFINVDEVMTIEDTLWYPFIYLFLQIPLLVCVEKLGV